MPDMAPSRTIGEQTALDGADSLGDSKLFVEVLGPLLVFMPVGSWNETLRRVEETLSILPNGRSEGGFLWSVSAMNYANALFGYTRSKGLWRRSN
jgi:hypothetical protein